MDAVSTTARRAASTIASTTRPIVPPGQTPRTPRSRKIHHRPGRRLSAGAYASSNRPDHLKPDACSATTSRLAVSGLVLGIGLGGFIDGIVLHQILQWHHMLTDHGRYATFPAISVPDLEDNSVADGLFHATTWACCAIGIALLWRALNGFRHPLSARPFVGLLLTGWGLFNLIEGVVDHHLLTIHHVRDDVADPLPWDVAFLVLGLILVLVGWRIYSSARTANNRMHASGASF